MPSQAAEVVFCVAMKGNDNWSGKIAEPDQMRRKPMARLPRSRAGDLALSVLRGRGAEAKNGLCPSDARKGIETCLPLSRNLLCRKCIMLTSCININIGNGNLGMK